MTALYGAGSAGQVASNVGATHGVNAWFSVHFSDHAEPLPLDVKAPVSRQPGALTFTDFQPGRF